MAKAQPGAYVLLQGARVDMYRSSMRIVVDKGQGSVEEAEGQSFAPNVSGVEVPARTAAAAPAAAVGSCVLQREQAGCRVALMKLSCACPPCRCGA